jgi:hypothetical protein
VSGRIRSVKPEWLLDERMALASSDARVLSIALILLADDWGNGRAGRVQLAGHVFPGKPLANALEELATWFVTLYEVDGQHYFSIRGWAKHQKVDKPGKPKVPQPSEALENVHEEEEKVRASRVLIPSIPDPDPSPLSDPPETAETTAVRKRPDPMGDSLRGRSPEQRADVHEIHEAFKLATGQPNLKFRAPYDEGAKAIAVSIDTDGFENTLIVARNCHRDGMVNGTKDEKRDKHDSAEYVFGKKHVFHRILKAALDGGHAGAPRKKPNAIDKVRAMKGMA